jgi:hypothetical protein
MDFNEYKKLKEEVKNKDFFSNYNGLSKFLFYASFVANGFSILFAYFHANKMIKQAITSPSPSIVTAVIVICIIILSGLEFFKRYLFDKFSLAFIREKFKFNGTEIKVLALSALLFVSLSFYLSLNGAKEFAAKKDEIKETTEITVESYQDSITTIYDTKISKIDSASAFLSQKKLDYEEKSEDAVTLRDKKYYRDQIKENQELIEKNDLKVKEFKKERDELLSKHKEKVESKADEKIASNADNSVRFLIFSTIIEFFIVIGIWFKNYYIHRGVSDFESKIQKDTKYKTFTQYNMLLDIIYSSDTKIGDPIPYMAQLNKIMKLSNSDLTGKELEDASKILTHLNILQKKGNKKIIKVDKESALEKIKEYLKIE